MCRFREEFAIKVMHLAAEHKLVRRGWVWIGSEWMQPSVNY